MRALMIGFTVAVLYALASVDVAAIRDGHTEDECAETMDAGECLAAMGE